MVLTALVDFRPIPLGDIDLYCEVGRRSERERRRGSVRRLYSARIHGFSEKATVALYQGKHAEKVGGQLLWVFNSHITSKKWRNDISRYSKLR